MMNLEKRFIEIHDLLKDHEILIQTEALDIYPSIPEKYLLWIDFLAMLEPLEKRTIENELTFDNYQNIPSSYKELLEKIISLTSLPQLDTPSKNLDKTLTKKMTLKKQHEISIITSQLKGKDIHHIIDIGSGAGHLSSVLLHNNNRRSLCIDKEEKFQKIGVDKFKRDMPELLDRLSFQTGSFNKNTNLKTLSESIVIGLHACGNLSVDILKNTISTHANMILNYACCFHKLDHTHINLSKITKQHPMKLSNHALTMAAKSHKVLTSQDILKRSKVKNFRYALHLLLDCNFETMGNATKKDYSGSFSDYVLKFVPNIQRSKEETQAFFESPNTKVEVQKILNLGIIRSHFARLIELYLIIDRALYLEENGFTVELVEAFDRSLSPRNISLFASRN